MKNMSDGNLPLSPLQPGDTIAILSPSDEVKQNNTRSSIIVINRFAGEFGENGQDIAYVPDIS